MSVRGLRALCLQLVDRILNIAHEVGIVLGRFHSTLAAQVCASLADWLDLGTRHPNAGRVVLERCPVRLQARNSSVDLRIRRAPLLIRLYRQQRNHRRST